MTGKHGASAGSATARPRKAVGWKVGFVAGAIVAIGAIGNLAWDVGNFGYRHIDVVKRIASEIVGVPPETAKAKPEIKVSTPPAKEADLFGKPMYFFTEEGENFRATLHGRNDAFEGVLEDVTSGSKGVIHGHRRANALVFEWGSADPARPGFGTYTLRPYTSASEDDDPIYAGVVVLHDCRCGRTVRYDGEIKTAEVLLTPYRDPPQYLKDLFFKKGVHPAPAVFPKAIQGPLK